MMSTKQVRNRRPRRNHPRHPRPDKRPTIASSDQVNSTVFISFIFIHSPQIVSNLVRQFNIWCNSLRIKPTYEFDRYENNHRCMVEN